MNRRRFLGLSIMGLLSHRLAQSRTRITREKPKKRRLLFNWDGSMIHCWGRSILPISYGPLTREQFVSLVFTPIEDTAVEAFFFSFGSGNVAEYQSHVLEWPGEADGFKFPESKTWHGGIAVDPKDQYTNPKGLADAGHNPPEMIVEECRKRGLDAFVSLRMNDIHDGQHPRDTWPNPELATFKRQNPDWLVEDLDWWSALNYAVPEVRELKLKVIEEFFDRWDFEGIELDWLRHTLYFTRGTERDNGRHLTDFMRTVRQSLNRRAKHRGRPIEIAVRVPERLEWCREAGFEVPTWIQEDLVDLLILGQGLTEAPRLSEFRELMKDRPLPIYPSLTCYGNGYQISPDEVIRGSAANLWRDGADGLYTFNWFHYGPWRKHLLEEIAEPHALAKKDKHYTLARRYEPTPNQPGADVVRYNTVVKEASVPFDLNVNDRSKTVAVPVADAWSSPSDRPRQVSLWMGLDNSAPGDLLEVSLNGQKLAEVDVVRKEQPSLGYQLSVPKGNGVLSYPAREKIAMRFRGIRLEVPVTIVRQGRNPLSVRLKARGKSEDRPLRVNRVELQTRF